MAPERLTKGHYGFGTAIFVLALYSLSQLILFKLVIKQNKAKTPDKFTSFKPETPEGGWDPALLPKYYAYVCEE